MKGLYDPGNLYGWNQALEGENIRIRETAVEKLQRFYLPLCFSGGSC